MSKHWALWQSHIQAPYCHSLPSSFLTVSSNFCQHQIKSKKQVVDEGDCLSGEDPWHSEHQIKIFFIKYEEAISRVAQIITGQDCIFVTG